MKKVLIGNPIRRNPKILKAYLEGLEKIEAGEFQIEYYLIDDNDSEESKKLLKTFKKSHPKNTHLIMSSEILNTQSPEFKTDSTGLHGWNENLIERVAIMKDNIIDFARKEGYDYLFLVDSDIVTQPDTMIHLAGLGKDIVSEIFWTDWHATGVVTPAVWMEDENTILNKKLLSQKDKFFLNREIASFYAMLRVPGTYRVGGLGALTLISKKALKAGVGFELIDNLSFYGEDRHFCVRARALGLDLWEDTCRPAFHIYRDSLLKNLNKFYKNGYKDEYVKLSNGNSADQTNKLKSSLDDTIKKLKKLRRDMIGLKDFGYRKIFDKKRVIRDKHHLTLMMMVRNEGDRYLEQQLKLLRDHIDYAVFLDNNSSDNTVDAIKRTLDGHVDYKIIHNDTSGFDNESKSRSRLWGEVVKTNPDWILALDADEIPEKKLLDKLPELMENKAVDIYAFKVYDMWREGFYREDELWKPSYWTLMIRYQPKFKYKYQRKKIHCDRLPYNAVTTLTVCNYPLKVQHLGWLRDEDKKKKYDRYMSLDSEDKFGSMEQYKSILDKEPNLVRFKESE